MNSIRKWFYRPRKDDPTLLAQFYYADEELNVVAGELDSFDGRKDPERCTALVNQLRQAQDKVLNICVEMMEDVLPDEREPRDFRVKFPDDVMQETLSGQLWFGAECLAAGSNILNREAESSRMRPLAKAVTKTIDNVRNLLREQCLKPIPDYTEKIRESLKIFDRLFADFEFHYVSAMMPVKSVDEYEMQQNVIVLFSDTLQRAVKLDLVSQEQIDNYDPALMFTIPRLAIVAGLVIFPDGPLNLERETKALSELFRPFKTLLLKIRELLWTMSRAELGALEKYLCSLEEPSITPHTLPKEQLLPEETFSYDGPTAFTCDFIQRFYSWHPSCRALAPQLLGAGVAKKCDRPERKRERHATKASRTRARQERQSARFLSRLTGEEERPRTHRRSRRSGASHHACCRSERDPTVSSRLRHPPVPRPPRALRQEFAIACACGNRNSAHECSASASLRQTETHNCANDAASGLAATACEDVADHLAASLHASHIVADAADHLAAASSLHVSHIVSADLPDAGSRIFFAESTATPDLGPVTATDCDQNDAPGDGPSSYRSCLAATDNPRCEASVGAASECRCDDSSGAASPHHSEDEEVALALQAAEVAASLKARERFCDASDLIQRLFVCVSGVADQLQTNYASDLRHILRSVFLMNQTPEEEDEPSMGCKRLHDDTTSTNSSDQLSVESAEDALIVIGSPVDDDGIDDDEEEEEVEEEDCEAALLGVSEDGGDVSPLPFGARPRSSSVVVSPSIFADHALMQYANMSPPPPNGTAEDADVSFVSEVRISPRTSPRASPESRDPMVPERRYSIVQEPPSWVPDHAAPRCMACGALFTLVRRRHHCRNCGKVFCGHCSRHSVPLPHFGIWRNVRVCNACFLVYVTSTADGSAALSS